MARANIKEKKENRKKIGIIASSIVASLAVIGVIVYVVLYFTILKPKDPYHYFEDLASYKINYASLEDNLDDFESQGTFVFIYDNNTFDAKQSEDDTEYDTLDQDITDQLLGLSKEIEEKNKEIGYEVFSLYLIDTSISGNEKILNNAEYGSVTNTPGLLFFDIDDNYSTTVPDKLANKIDPEYKNVVLSGNFSKDQVKRALRDSKEIVNSYGRK